MITALTALLVLVSLALVVTVTVALATPGEWESSKDQFNKAWQNELSIEMKRIHVTGFMVNITEDLQYSEYQLKRK